jgi:glycosyltransferase involved in cell wall biosynthesis
MRLCKLALNATPQFPPMRILHVLATLNPAYGGPVEAVKHLGTFVARWGIQVEIAVCADLPTDRWVMQYPLPVHALGPGTGKRYCYTPRLRPWLAKNGRTYDAWVINGIWQYNSIGAAPVARRLGVPYFVYTHGMLDPWNKSAQPLKHLKKQVYWSLFEREVLRGARAVCFTAEEEARLAATYFNSAPWKAYVVGSGIAPPEPPTAAAIEALMQRFPEIRRKRCWIFLGRIHPKKGIDLLLESYAAVCAGSPDLHLIVAGPGDHAYASAMKELALNLGVAARVSFTGPLYGESKWAALALSELFVLPSHQENFGVAVVEALAMSVPVCISDKVNIWREVSASHSGIVCPDTEAGLRGALQRWEGFSVEARAPYAPAAVACFNEHFHVERAARRYAARIAQEVTGTSAVPAGEFPQAANANRPV